MWGQEILSSDWTSSLCITEATSEWWQTAKKRMKHCFGDFKVTCCNASLMNRVKIGEEQHFPTIYIFAISLSQ